MSPFATVKSVRRGGRARLASWPERRLPSPPQIRRCTIDASGDPRTPCPAFSDHGCAHQMGRARTPPRPGSGRSMRVHHSRSSERRAGSFVPIGAVRAEFLRAPGVIVCEQTVRVVNSPSQLCAIPRDNKSPGGSHHQGSVHDLRHLKFVRCSSASPGRTVF
jgi:hypothetical protein